MYQKNDWNNLLIAEVKKRPILYAKDCKDHYDKHAKTMVWEDICEILVPFWNDMDLEERAAKTREVKGKWQNLRTSFKRALNDEEKGISRSRKYVYFDRLRFLIDNDDINELKETAESDPLELKRKISTMRKNFIQSFDEPIERGTPKRQKTESLSSSVDSIFEEMAATDEPVQNDFEESFTNSSIKNEESQKMKNESYEERRYPSVSPHSFKRIQSEVMDEEIDEDKHFLLSLIPALKNMTKKQKISTKIKFLQIIGEVQSEDDYVTYKNK